MPCEKCGYKDKKERIIDDKTLCQICAKLAPKDNQQFLKYVDEKLDWKQLETFRKFNQSFGESQKQGMEEKAKQGNIQTRPPLGYSVVDGKLKQNKKSAKVYSLFNTFLKKDYSLNSMAKYYGLSVNGLKKILQNRTYLGEIKFANQLHKASHKPLIPEELFYAVQRKLGEVLRG